MTNPADGWSFPGNTASIQDPNVSSPPAAASARPQPRPAFALPVPPLRGPGVALRPWAGGVGDGITLSRAWNDPDVVRWTTVPNDRSVEAARRWIAGEADRRARGRAVDLVITRPGDADHIDGEVGFVLVEPSRGWAEVGYWLFPESRGQGRAAIALQLLTDWALHDLGVRRLFARADAANPRAGAVARRAGYDLAGVLDGGVQVWVRDRPHAAG